MKKKVTMKSKDAKMKLKNNNNNNKKPLVYMNVWNEMKDDP